MSLEPMLNSSLSLKSSNEVAMFRKSLVISMSLTFAVSVGAAGGETPSQAKLSAAAIVDKNVAARGGLQAWRGVQTMTLSGKLGAGGNQRATLATPVPDAKSLSVAGRLSRTATRKPGGLASDRGHIPGQEAIA